MDMNDTKKKELIQETFELLKNDTDTDTLSKLALVVGKMYALDAAAATDMWRHLLQKNQTHLQTSTAVSDNLIWKTIYESKKTIGKEELQKIILNDSVIKQSVFSDDIGCWNVFGGGYLPMSACKIIHALACEGDTSEVNECLTLLYNNTHRKASWYEIMNYILQEAVKNIDEKMYNLLNSWCEKADTEKERAKLRIILMESF